VGDGGGDGEERVRGGGAAWEWRRRLLAWGYRMYYFVAWHYFVGSYF